MRYPLDEYQQLETGFSFGDIYPAGFGSLSGKPHLGVDKGGRENYGWNVYAPTNGVIENVLIGHEGGRTVHFIDDEGRLWRFLHLLNFSSPGPKQEGEVLGHMGNSGAVFPKPSPLDTHAGTHLHYDVSVDGTLVLNAAHFINPEVYIRRRIAMTYDNHIIRNARGEFALVIRGKKFVFNTKFTIAGEEFRDYNTAALLTFLDRTGNESVVNVTNEEYDRIPISEGLNF